MRERNKNIWWQNPRKAIDMIENRRVSFLELFYDLAFVGYISQITHGLAQEPSIDSLGQYLLLFFIGWWAWNNGSSYLDTHGNDDLRTRVFTFLQLIGIVGMAIFSHSAYTNGTGYVLSYSFLLLVLTHLWFQTGVSDPLHRKMSLPYSVSFFIAMLVFLSSLFFDSKYYVPIWIISTLISMGPMFYAMFFIAPNANPDDPYTFSISESFKERTGIFTIIIIGEIILGVINNGSHIHHMSSEHLILSLLSTLLGIMVWWLYFDYISRRMPKKGVSYHFSWLFGQVPILLGINIIGACTAMFVANENVIHSTEFNNLFLGATIIFLLGIMYVWLILDKSKDGFSIKLFIPFNILGIIVIIILGFFDVTGIPLLLSVNFILLIITMFPIIIAFSFHNKQKSVK